MLHQLLPLLDGWRYQFNDFSYDEQNVNAPNLGVGKSLPIVKSGAGRGWLLSADILTNSIDVRFRISIDGDDDAHVIDHSADLLIVGNVITPQPFYFYVPRFSKIPTPFSGQITLAATAYVLGTAYLAPDAILTLKARKANAGTIWIGNGTGTVVSNNTSIRLDPGESVDLRNVVTLGNIYVRADVALDWVDVVYEDFDVVNVNSRFYPIAMTPAVPIPFQKFLKVEVFNPPQLNFLRGGGPNANAALVFAYKCAYIIIDNEQAFRDSLARVLGTNALAALVSATGAPTPVAALPTVPRHHRTPVTR